MTATAPSRFTRSRPCPICSGWDQQPRGRAIRCFGYLDSTGDYARCTREEHAGQLERNADETYSHVLKGLCRCGRTHGLKPVTSTEPRRISAEYNYRAATGELLYQVVRYTPKAFSQRRPDGQGGWAWSLNGTPRVPYKLPEILSSRD